MKDIILRAGLLAASALLITTPADAQMKRYCIEGSQFTCFAIEYDTQPSANGTTATVRVRNLQGSAIPGVASHVGWSRLHHVEFLGMEGPTFQGGSILTNDPAVATVGNAT